MPLPPRVPKPDLDEARPPERPAPAPWRGQDARKPGTRMHPRAHEEQARHVLRRVAKPEVRRLPQHRLELHSYAVDPAVSDIRKTFRDDLEYYFPELRGMTICHERLQVRNDFPAFAPGQWALRPSPKLPIEGLLMAGDWVRLPFPMTHMEAAFTPGLVCANEILDVAGLRQEVVYSVATRGCCRGARRTEQLVNAPQLQTQVIDQQPYPLRQLARRIDQMNRWRFETPLREHRSEAPRLFPVGNVNVGHEADTLAGGDHFGHGVVVVDADAAADRELDAFGIGAPPRAAGEGPGFFRDADRARTDDRRPR